MIGSVKLLELCKVTPTTERFLDACPSQIVRTKLKVTLHWSNKLTYEYIS